MVQDFRSAGAVVLVAAHNEANSIGECLEALALSVAKPRQIIVIANGCHDATAMVARSYVGVEVLELREASKSLALNLGESVARGFPRIYLDADIVVPPAALAELTSALVGGRALAAVPGRVVNTNGRPWLVRAYFAVNERLPVFRDGLFGRGVIALSLEGRSRFDRFPVMVADDLFLDSLFSSEEKVQVGAVSVVLDAPATVSDLIRRLVRVRRGNRAMRDAAKRGDVPAEVQGANHWSWLRDVVIPEPRLALSGGAYALLSLIAAVRARRGSVDDLDWGRSGVGPR